MNNETLCVIFLLGLVLLVSTYGLDWLIDHWI